MADVMKMRVVGTATVTFSPLISPEYERPDAVDRKVFEASDGGLWYSDFGSKQKHIVKVNNMSKTNGEQINTWWQNRTLITFTPDVEGAPGTTIYVRVMNEQQPFQMWFGAGTTSWQNLYDATLVIHEASSSSSSSSSATP